MTISAVPKLLAAAMLALTLAACGGDEADEAIGGAEATIEQALEDDDVVREEAERLQDVVTTELDDLSSATSVQDVEESVADARAELSESRDRLEDANVSEDVEEQRDELVATIEQLEAELADLQEAAEDGDLMRALDSASGLSVDDLQRELEEATR